MVKDLTKPINQFVKSVYSHRDDLTIQVIKKVMQGKPFYKIHILILIKPTDGLYATINKGIDRFFLIKEIISYFNFTESEFSVTYQNVYPETIY